MGKVTRSCIYKMSRVPDNAEITTIEGVGTISDMHPIQVAWMAYGCAQCGFCSPGFIISAKVLLDNNPSPTREEVRDWFNKQRNLCRCTGYKPLIDATMAAAAVMRGEMTKEDLVFKQTGDSIVGTNYIRPSPHTGASPTNSCSPNSTKPEKVTNSPSPPSAKPSPIKCKQSAPSPPTISPG